ncbi:MAG: ATP12 family protein [Pseudomonadota bacterium]
MKRFYKEVQVIEAQGGWSVALDGKPIRTPAKTPFVAQTAAMAEAAAEEWRAQEAEVKPAEMPVTKAVNSAIDRTAVEYEGVVEMVAGYGGSDLLCYRADGPEGLIARQAEAWDPLLLWAAKAHGARLLTTTGVMHALQPEDGQRALRAAVAAHDPFELTGLYDLVALSGSLVIGLAVSSGRLSPEEGWTISRIDETWQEEFWGVDEEAAKVAARKAGEFAAAARFVELARRK